MIRKPEFYNNITGLRKKLKDKFKRSETIEKKISLYKERNKAYTRQKNNIQKIKKQQTKLYKKTKSSLKGKSKEEIKKIWLNYNEKKKEIKTTISEKSAFTKNYKKQTSYNYTKDYDFGNTTHKEFEISGDITDSIRNLYESEIKDSSPQPKFIQIILKGKSDYQIKNDMDFGYYSDSFSIKRFVEQALYDTEETITQIILNNMTQFKSGENFQIENIYIRLIYAKDKETKA